MNPATQEHAKCLEVLTREELSLYAAFYTELYGLVLHTVPKLFLAEFYAVRESAFDDETLAAISQAVLKLKAAAELKESKDEPTVSDRTGLES